MDGFCIIIKAEMKLYIKNMVCPRCIMAIEQTLKQLNIAYQSIRLGEVVTDNELTDSQIDQFRSEIEALGFELLNDSQKQTIEQIKDIIIAHIHHTQEKKTNISEIISSKLRKEYSSLSKLFSTTEGITIEQYVILQKTERIKELLSYDEQTLSEIAIDMGYSSVAHLSAQFKKITGMTPTQFKSQGIHLRQSLDRL